MVTIWPVATSRSTPSRLLRAAGQGEPDVTGVQGILPEG
jgi:hypothetical protein